MSGIVCAIRGGPDSKPTIDRSIALAGETGLPIYFLYVVNLDFFTHTARSRVHTVAKEMHEMGEFILLTAQAKADAQGVRAEGVVRHGQVIDEIISLCQEISADYVILGEPRGREGIDNLAHEHLTQIGERITKESGARVVLVEVGTE
jgi:nucleotide-binding universal stress UspA family protein